MSRVTDRYIRTLCIDNIGFSRIDEADTFNQPAERITVFFYTQRAPDFSIAYHRRGIADHKFMALIEIRPVNGDFSAKGGTDIRAVVYNLLSAIRSDGLRLRNVHHAHCIRSGKKWNRGPGRIKKSGGH